MAMGWAGNVFGWPWYWADHGLVMVWAGQWLAWPWAGLATS